MVSKDFKASLAGLGLLALGYLGMQYGVPAYFEYKKNNHIVTEDAPRNIKKEGIFNVIENDNVTQPLHDEKAALYFTANWCPPCRKLRPKLEDALSKHPEIRAYKVDYDENRGARNYFKVEAIPVVLVMRKGNEVARLVGNHPAKLEKILSK